MLDDTGDVADRDERPESDSNSDWEFESSLDRFGDFALCFDGRFLLPDMRFCAYVCGCK